jgi:hypothetical protein
MQPAAWDGGIDIASALSSLRRSFNDAWLGFSASSLVMREEVNSAWGNCCLTSCSAFSKAGGPEKIDGEDAWTDLMNGCLQRRRCGAQGSASNHFC